MGTSSATPGQYDFTAIEARWQRHWADEQTFKTRNPGEPGADPNKPKFYILDMFPYPSGAGLHVGHPLGYCATDIVARYKRMRGFNVLHPMGFDAFGLPAEQYAIAHNVHPAVTTKANVDNYRRQLRMFGFSYDWDREVATCEPSYYKFTQWIFALMFESWYDDQCAWTDPQGRETVGRARPIAELVAELEAGRWTVSPGLEVLREAASGKGRPWSALDEAERRGVLDKYRLAFIDEVPVNWCPALGTVLANEEVDAEGRSARGGHPVYRKPLRQWMLRITKYCERLLTDLEELDWPEPIKLMQRNWIGRSTGAECLFLLADHWQYVNGQFRSRAGGATIPPGTPVDDPPHSIRVYTTRPDTLYGATYMVLAPEHPLVARITTPEQQAEVTAYVKAAAHKSELDRTADTKDKTGVFTGAYALNPVTGEPVPIWVADYVLMGYGTGAIMAVPGHDTRDFEFAKEFSLPMIAVVQPPDEWFHQQLIGAGIDTDYCHRQDRDDLARILMESASGAAGIIAGITAQDATAVVDGDVGWVHQVALPAFAQDPGVFVDSFVGEGLAMNSGAFDGTPTAEFKRRITARLEEQGLGRGAVNYKLRDWIFSRQKYWGEPFPVLHGEAGETIALPLSELPVELPPMEDFKPTVVPDDSDTLPEPPLGRAREWVAVERDGQRYRRDLNTMPQWAGSCWYYLRFADPGNSAVFCAPEAERYWLPVDLYVGGAEHAVLHLLYARFWHKVLFDQGHVSTREPFQKLFNQGMIQSFAARTRKGVVVALQDVGRRNDAGEFVPLNDAECARFVAGELSDAEEAELIDRASGEPVNRVIAKMSKSLKNVVNPDEIIAQYGADTFRLYEMYMGPLEASKPWNTRDVPGLHKLCQKIWRLVVDQETGELSPALVDAPLSADQQRLLHQTIKRVTEDVEAIKLNTAIAAMFEFVNATTPLTERPRALIEPFVLLIAPFVPHLAEELWHRLGHGESLAYAPWPEHDEALAAESEIELAVQVQGKIKARITVPADAGEDAIKAAALAQGKVQAAMAGKQVRKVFIVPGRLVNFIVG